ncbi:hypothetical protein EBZ80_17985 [bacterium]|nr:hypothetical protein [bacterium]
MIPTFETDMWFSTVSFLTQPDMRCLWQTCHALLQALPYTEKDVNARSLGIKLRYHAWATTTGKRSRAIVLGCTKQIFGEAILHKRVIQQALPALAKTIGDKMKECAMLVPSFNIYLDFWNGKRSLPPKGSFARQWLCIHGKRGVLSFLLPRQT